MCWVVWLLKCCRRASIYCMISSLFFRVCGPFMICKYVFLRKKYHASSSFLWMNDVITWTRITNINRVGSMNLAIYIFLLYAFCFFTACGLFAIYLWYTVYADIFYSWRYNRCYSSSCITKTIAHWHNNIRSFCWFEIRSLFDR